MRLFLPAGRETGADRELERQTVSTRGPQETVSGASIAVAAFSTIVEWYDFTLYLYLATVLSRVFFGGGETALLTTLATFAIAYLLRPLGGLVFGHIGDRFGRRRTILLSMAIMTIAMFGTALLPTHAQAGAAAGWLLFLLRCIMGFSVGGEYNAIVAYLLEGAPRDRRGLIASMASASSEVGGLFAVGVSLLTVNSMSPASLDSWGWRIPFLVGGALAGSVWIARTTMEESPEFNEQRASGTVPQSPLLYALANYRAGILRAFAISALGSITYYVGITYVPAFLTSAGKLGEGDSLRLSTVAAFAVILVTPFTGALSDRLGRKPILIFLSACSAILPIVLFYLMARGSPLYALSGTVILSCIAGAVSAVGAITAAEQFPGEGRISGLALGATSATAIFGGLTPYVAQALTERTGWILVPGAMIAVVAVCALPILVALPETAPRKIITTTLQFRREK
jgi:MFS transporter, MHS family, proline/betaine transporter